MLILFTETVLPGLNSLRPPVLQRCFSSSRSPYCCLTTSLYCDLARRNIFRPKKKKKVKLHVRRRGSVDLIMCWHVLCDSWYSHCHQPQSWYGRIVLFSPECEQETFPARWIVRIRVRMALEVFPSQFCESCPFFGTSRNTTSCIFQICGGVLSKCMPLY